MACDGGSGRTSEQKSGCPSVHAVARRGAIGDHGETGLDRALMIGCRSGTATSRRCDVGELTGELGSSGRAVRVLLDDVFALWATHLDWYRRVGVRVVPELTERVLAPAHRGHIA